MLIDVLIIDIRMRIRSVVDYIRTM